MRNIFLFIRRFFTFFLFLLLQALSIAILIKYNKTYEAVFANTANEVTGSIDKRYNNVQYYLQLKQENERLAKQNAELLSSLTVSFKEDDSTQITKIDSLIRDTSGRIQKFIFLPAKVVNNSVTQENNYITIEKGSNQGVTKDMAVTGPDGIVGRVILVSENYSRVMSLLNHNSKVSVMLKKGGYAGIVDWDGKDPGYLVLHNITTSAKVAKGDTVITSNLSGNFPPGLMVGTVSQITTNPSSNFFTIKLKTATNFYNLQYAYLVQNMLWEEQRNLEAQTPKTP
jgi:rod shape-determining protein MreC